MSAHPFESVKAGVLEGKFIYSSDGTVKTFSFNNVPSPMNPLDFKNHLDSFEGGKKLLLDNYGESLAKMPSRIYNPNQPINVVEGIAQRVFNEGQVLDELVKKGAGGSPEATFLMNEIESIIRTTEGKYGAVFKKQ